MKLSVLSGIALSGMLAVTGVAVAQDQPAGGESGGVQAAAPEAETSYKAKTVYDFEDDMVEGDLQRPDGELVDGTKKAEHASLIEIRPNFIAEMQKTLEDL